jgi:zinc protease
MLETIGLDWKIADEYVAKLKSVTAEQVMQVANKYFVDDRLTVGELIPVKAKEEEAAK